MQLNSCGQARRSELERPNSRKGMNGTLLVLAAIAALAFSAVSLRADMVGYWNFDNNVNDSSGYSNNGTINGTVPYTTGKFGGANGAVSFSAVDANYVDVANSPSLSAAWTGYTVSLWVKTLYFDGFAMNKWDGSGTAGFGFGYNPGWYLGTGPGYDTVSAGTYNNNTWINMVLRWDGSSAKSYRNGALVDSKSLAFSNSTINLYFGKRNSSTTYNGLVDDAAVFNTCLSEAEAKAIYNVKYPMANMSKLFALYANAGGTTNTSDGMTWEYVASGLTGNPGELVTTNNRHSIIFSDSGSAGVRSVPSGSGLIGYWNFDNNVNDSSGQTNNGTINGSVPYTEGKFGGANGAVSFSGNSANYVDAASSLSLSAPWPGYTVSLWMKTSSKGGLAMTKIAGDNSAGFMVGYDPGWYQCTGIANGTTDLSAGNYNNNAWRNLVLRWDGSAAWSYLDGVLVTNKSSTYANSTEGVVFGRRNSGTLPYSGLVDDAAIFGLCLSAAEAKAIYNVGTSALGYSMADMSKLFEVYANAGGHATTSDGKTWKYIASGLPGNPGELAGAVGSYSIKLSDTGSAGVQQPSAGTIVIVR